MQEMANTPARPYSIKAVEGGYLIRVARGAPVTESLVAALTDLGVEGGSISAIGALEQVELGYFDRDAQTYLHETVDGVYELLSLLGNIAMVDGKPFVHAHVTLGDRNMRVTGGHFFDGVVAVTLEAVVRDFGKAVHRAPDAETGLKLLDLQ